MRRYMVEKLKKYDNKFNFLYVFEHNFLRVGLWISFRNVIVITLQVSVKLTVSIVHTDTWVNSNFRVSPISGSAIGLVVSLWNYTKLQYRSERVYVNSAVCENLIKIRFPAIWNTRWDRLGMYYIICNLLRQLSKLHRRVLLLINMHFVLFFMFEKIFHIKK